MALIINQGEAKSQFKIFKLQQGASITTNVCRSIKKNLRGFVDNTNIYHCWGVL